MRNRLQAPDNPRQDESAQDQTSHADYERHQHPNAGDDAIAEIELTPLLSSLRSYGIKSFRF